MLFMASIDEIIFATDENTPKDDKRLLELDVLSAMAEECIILFRQSLRTSQSLSDIYSQIAVLAINITAFLSA